MACVTLKRPLEWTDPSMSAEPSSPSGASSPTSMIISNSPPHTGSRSPKRLCLGHGFGSPSSSYYHQHGSHHTTPLATHSTNSYHSNTSTPNSYFKPIPSSAIAEQIREEMIRLKLIKNRSSGTSTVATSTEVTKATSSATSSTKVKSKDSVTSEEDGNKSPSPSESSMSSPSSSPRAHEDSQASTTAQASKKSNDDNAASSSTNNTSPYSLYTRLINNSDSKSITKSTSTSESSTSVASSSSTSPAASLKRPRTNSVSAQSKPLFNFNQVVMIVERLLREKEDVIRKEYDQALNARLAEQYDQFVKFSYDQIQRRFDSQALPSYLS